MNSQIQIMLQQAIQALQAENSEQAESILKKILQADSKNFSALNILGLIMASRANFKEASEFLKKAVRIKPNDPAIQYNLAKSLHDVGSLSDSIPHHKKAVELGPNNPKAWLNYGKTLLDLSQSEEALFCFDQALKLTPDYVEAFINKGISLYTLKRYDEAIAHYDQALTLKPDYTEAYLLKGLLLNDLGRIEEAIYFYQEAYNLNKSNRKIYQNICFAKMCICDWNTIDNEINNLEKIILDDEIISTPFIFLSIVDNLKQHQKASKQYAKQILSNTTNINSDVLKITNKTRIGYYSADFYNHATGYLMAGLFEQHNRDQFELIAFSFGPRTNDGMRQRLEKAFDQFIEVGNMSDMEVAKLSRELDIAIAVDLKGFTQRARPGIFAYRAAPIQVNYLGYPGTMGASYIDYIVADPILIPPEFQDFYTEKVIYLPYSYQVNDRKREISDRKFSRAEVGLPEKGFIFCCFNNNYKILPEIFDIWMRILQTVDQSVLWLLEDNPAAAKNLKFEAVQRGIDPGRLVFAQRLPSAEHLARHALADLFIDTFPYNAHTTASDALWSGLPLVTLQGESFASRVASSLLSAVGLPELITHTTQEYESLVIELAMNPQKLASIKQKLLDHRMNTPLFDTDQYTKHLENAYLQMYERYRADLASDHITIIT